MMKSKMKQATRKSGGPATRARPMVSAEKLDRKLSVVDTSFLIAGCECENRVS
ncbi:MAG: hypothetical protein WBY94_16610 [Polyangiaceae bacterium]